MEFNIPKLKNYTKNISVLYVEDDEVIQEQMNLFLSRFFPNIDLAGNGKEALLACDKKKYDLIITDISMPVMDGIEMIKELNKFEDIPVILVTSAYNDANSLMDLINLNITQFIMKPFNHKQFLISMYYISEKIFLKKEYQNMQEKLKLSNKTLREIQENSKHPVIVLEKDKIQSANSAFIALSGYSDFESLTEEMPQIGTFFSPGFNCIQAKDNNDFIQTLKSTDKSKHLVQQYHKKREHPTIYSVNYTEVSKEEEIYQLSFTDITPYLEHYRFDRTTKLPNRRFIFEEIESVKMENETTYAMAISIKHFNEYAKWKGKQGAKDFERLIANQIYALIHENGFHDIFLSYFSVNQFLLLSSSPLNMFVHFLNDFNIHPIDLDEEKQRLKKFNFSPIHKLLSFPASLETEELEILLINTYDELSF